MNFVSLGCPMSYKRLSHKEYFDQILQDNRINSKIDFRYNLLPITCGIIGKHQLELKTKQQVRICSEPKSTFNVTIT